MPDPNKKASYSSLSLVPTILKLALDLECPRDTIPTYNPLFKNKISYGELKITYVVYARVSSRPSIDGLLGF